MDAVPTPLVLLANFLIALALFGVAASMSLVRLLSRRSVTLAALPLVSAVLLTLYVFGEDSYRGNGVSRWDAYRSPGRGRGGTSRPRGQGLNVRKREERTCPRVRARAIADS